MIIHSLFILQKTGVCIYSRNFTEEFKSIEPNLITPFFSAIFSFSENVISKKTPEILEMGGLKFIFKIHNDLIFAILSDSSSSILFIKSRMERLTEVFNNFIDSNDIDENEIIESSEFDQTIDSIITGEEDLVVSQPLYRKIIDFINNLVFENEILGAALMNINGKVIYSSLPQDILLSSLKELEIRYTVSREFNTTFYSLENEQKVFAKTIKIPWKLDPLLFVVLFDSTVHFGMAEINLDKISKTIENII